MSSSKSSISRGGRILRVGFAALIVLLSLSPEMLALSLGMAGDADLARLSKWKLGATSSLIVILSLLELLTSSFLHRADHGTDSPVKYKRDSAIEALLSVTRMQVWRQATILTLSVLGLLSLGTYARLDETLYLLALGSSVLGFAVVLWSALAPVDMVISRAISDLIQLITGAGARTVQAFSTANFLGSLSGKAVRTGTVAATMMLASKNLHLLVL